MSIATIVSRGFGSFGAATKLPTRGYSIGSAVNPVYGGRFSAAHVYFPGMQKATVANTGFAAASVHNPGFQRAGATR